MNVTDKVPLKILIITVGAPISPSLIKAIKDNEDGRRFYLIGVDSFANVPGAFLVNKFYKIRASWEDEEGFLDDIKKIIEKEKVNIMIPTANEDCLAIARNAADFSGIKILCNDHNLTRKIFDKGYVYEVLKKDIPSVAPVFEIVNTYNAFVSAYRRISSVNKKVVIKPRYNRGGRGVYIILDELEFDEFFSKKPENLCSYQYIDRILKQRAVFDDLIVMEYLPGRIYSVYALSRNGEQIIAIPHIREWGNASQTLRGSIEWNDFIENSMGKIAKVFNLSYTFNAEFAASADGRVILFDLNPRLAASSGVDRFIGVNFAYLSLKLLLGEEIHLDLDVIKKRKYTFMRYFDEVYIDTSRKDLSYSPQGGL